MWNTFDVARLYDNVLHFEIMKNSVNEEDMRRGIQIVRRAYRPQKEQRTRTESYTEDNSIAYRCAYLHMYTPVHTAMVYYVMNWALVQEKEYFQSFLHTRRRSLKICNLGGGPGADLIGVITAFQKEFGYFHTSATIIDIVSEWKDIFGSIINELRYGFYGYFELNPQYFEWSFLTANLMDRITGDVNNAINSADFITMIKFVSAVVHQNATGMIKNIFKKMKPGALVLFIDNDAGGSREVVLKVANECQFKPVFGPFAHHLYINEELLVQRFGYWNCHKTAVTVVILEKPISTE
ncbi:uncharacterized protein TNCT_377941 [Trichonephila clavata]|uniref:Uncharacterized protein n=1 Tax=Trichonephila clavata TaxID=2740835 RepID=A0A8X6IH88_TRICU|nr:uncharacterized protein TNCT_377941 [Trichonephila clavata]